jgi:hypothetical protein
MLKRCSVRRPERTISTRSRDLVDSGYYNRRRLDFVSSMKERVGCRGVCVKRLSSQMRRLTEAPLQPLGLLFVNDYLRRRCFQLYLVIHFLDQRSLFF